MRDRPLVSAIIIFLNEEQFIEEAIASVFAQSYVSWELLLVDDGSTDGSTAIARRYAEQYPEKVRYLDHAGHQNRGMSASRNLGARHAAGTYIAFLDGDDVWLPHKLEQQVAILENQPEASMVYGPLRRWYSWNGNPDDLYREDLFGLGKKGVHPYANRLVEPPKLLTLFLRDDSFIPGGILIRREVFERLGGFEDAFRGMYEDTVFMTKVCLAENVFVSSECWYKYRMHQESCTFVAWSHGKTDTDRLAYLSWVERYLSQHGARDRRLWRALRQAQRRTRYAWLERALDYRSYVGLFERAAISVGLRVLPGSTRQWLWQQWNRYKYTVLGVGR